MGLTLVNSIQNCFFVTPSPYVSLTFTSQPKNSLNVFLLQYFFFIKDPKEQWTGPRISCSRRGKIITSYFLVRRPFICSLTGHKEYPFIFHEIKEKRKTYGFFLVVKSIYIFLD